LTKIKRFNQDWFTDCQYRQLSPSIIDARRTADHNLFWLANDLDVKRIGR